LADLQSARSLLPANDFRHRLRHTLLSNPTITLRQVAQALGVTRQRAGSLVGRLNRPTCAEPGPRPAPQRDRAASRLEELKIRVQAGEPAARAARELGISLPVAMHLGFRAKAIRPPHGTWDRAKTNCNCWRCRVVSGLATPRGPRTSAAQKAAVEDWLAYTDPDDNKGLSQAKVAGLVGVGQAAVSRIARAVGE
jgi:predicted XRE-type DNA-binding protein